MTFFISAKSYSSTTTLRKTIFLAYPSYKSHPLLQSGSKIWSSIDCNWINHMMTDQIWESLSLTLCHNFCGKNSARWSHHNAVRYCPSHFKFLDWKWKWIWKTWKEQFHWGMADSRWLGSIGRIFWSQIICLILNVNLDKQLFDTIWWLHLQT